MNFQIVDTESAYRRLLTAPDAAVRETVFRQDLIEPFMGLVQIFGGDGLATFAQYGMRPEQFTGDNQAVMADLIEVLAGADAWSRAEQALKEGWAAFAAYAEQIPLEKIIFGLYLADMSASPQLKGYTGFGGIPGWIMTVYGSANAYNLERVEAATVHELHHNILGAAKPQASNMMQVTVGDYMVMEGLAESFSAELYGADKVGPWVSDFDDANLETTKAVFKSGLDVSGFNEVRRYIFSDPELGLPPSAGYALGYRVVQAYLERTGKSVVDSTFIPAGTIIRYSDFF
jgi:uncharacterized protein YjaZ